MLRGQRRAENQDNGDKEKNSKKNLHIDPGTNELYRRRFLLHQVHRCPTQLTRNLTPPSKMSLARSPDVFGAPGKIRLRLRRSLVAVFVVVALGLHLLELLFLRVVQQSLDLAVRVLHNGLHLGAAVVLAERVVGAKGLHLLEAVSEDRLDLRYLVAAEAEPLAQMLRLLGWVEGAVLARLPLSSGRLIGVWRLCEHECRAGGKQNAQSNSCFSHVVHQFLLFGRALDHRPLQM
jgi:hypothetical protein